VRDDAADAVVVAAVADGVQLVAGGGPSKGAV
jgi:hypothetical protein